MTAVAPVQTRRLALRTLGLGAVGALAGPAWAQGAQAVGPLPGVDVADWPAGQPTPALLAPDLQGHMVDLASLRGKVTMINFWASWCAPCRVEMPLLQAVPELLGEDRVAVLAVNFKEPPRTVGRFVAAQQWRVPVVLDTSGAVAQAWGVKVFPTTFLVDPQGRARQVIRGEVDWSDATALGWVERLLAA